MDIVNFIIISRNRASLVKNAVDFALKKPEVYIHIMDMKSEYIPLKNYLKLIQNNPRVTVYNLENLGPRKLWINDTFKNITKPPNGFFLSDGDIDYSDTNIAIFDYFMELSKEFPGIRKIGSALRLDDLPKNTSKSKKIGESELSNWDSRRFIDRTLFLAPADTQFAYYPRYTNLFYLWPAIRVAGPYQIRHMPWYYSNEQMSEEEKFYVESAIGWGGHTGTSHERGIMPGDTDPESLLTIRFYKLIRALLLITPKYGSFFLAKIIKLRNKDSYLTEEFMRS
jgi:hypothetical protein